MENYIKMLRSVDTYFSTLKKWQPELEALRVICLDSGLTEELKWNIPIYTYKGKNIVGINGFKGFCAISFFKGALLQDEEGILNKIGSVQVARWVKFTMVSEIAKLKRILKAYIFEAIEVEKAGLKVPKKKTSDYPIPEEFQKKLNQLPALKKAFYALTAGRQRAYIFYFSQAKQSKTRAARVEKYIPQILSGKGMIY